jgi:hypothetical protein
MSKVFVRESVSRSGSGVSTCSAVLCFFPVEREELLLFARFFRANPFLIDFISCRAWRSQWRRSMKISLVIAQTGASFLLFLQTQSILKSIVDILVLKIPQKITNRSFRPKPGSAAPAIEYARPIFAAFNSDEAEMRASKHPGRVPYSFIPRRARISAA